MSLASSLDNVLTMLDTVTPTEWAAGLQAVLKDVKANSSTEEDILDGVKAVLPQFAIVADLAELYFAAGGKPAPNSSLVFQRRDADDMNRDI